MKKELKAVEAPKDSHKVTPSGRSRFPLQSIAIAKTPLWCVKEEIKQIEGDIMRSRAREIPIPGRVATLQEILRKRERVLHMLVEQKARRDAALKQAEIG